MEKKTNREMYEMIKELLNDNAEVVEFCNGKLAKLGEKEDPYYETVLNALDAETALNASDILVKINMEELTLGKIRARLSKAVREGAARKETVNGIVVYYKA